MATLLTNKTTSSSVAKAVHAGVNSISAVYSLTASLSAGDVIQMVKVPAGAVIIDIVMTETLGAGSAHGLAVGDGNSTGRYYATTSLSSNAIVRATSGVPYSYSVDDTIDIVVSGASSATIGGGISLTVYYKMDDPFI